MDIAMYLERCSHKYQLVRKGFKKWRRRPTDFEKKAKIVGASLDFLDGDTYNAKRIWILPFIWIDINININFKTRNVMSVEKQFQRWKRRL